MGWKSFKRKISWRRVKKGLKKLEGVIGVIAAIAPFFGIPLPLILTQIAQFGIGATALKRIGISQEQVDQIGDLVQDAKSVKSIEDMSKLRTKFREIKITRKQRRKLKFA